MEIGANPLLIFIWEEWKLLTFLTVLLAFYCYGTSTFDYFEKKGIKYLKPTVLVGNWQYRVLGTKSCHEFNLEVYNHFKGQPYAGFFEGRLPVLLILDPDLIKIVTTRDFDYFADRPIFSTNEPNYISRNLLQLKGQQWKAVRSVITPSFSSMRLKLMMPLMQQCADNLINFLKQYDQKEIEIKNVTLRYTLEVIGVTTFGIKYDSTSSDSAKFIELAGNFDYIPLPKRLFMLLTIILWPTLLKFIDISFLNRKSCDKLTAILNMAKAQRKPMDSNNCDYLQGLIDAAAKEKEEIQQGSKTRAELDDDTLNGQFLIFLIAGYDTTSSLLTFTIYTLAIKPDLQTKMRAHIEEVTNGKELTYEILAELDYLQAFFYEILRFYPPSSRMDRECTKPYTLPGTNIQINVGEVIAVPLYGIHMDPDIYPNPTEFRPERFLGEEKNQRPAHLYLAFGTGPRGCIGPRFAMVSAKIAMVSILKNFKFSTCSRTEIPILMQKRPMMLKAVNGIWLKIEKI